MEKKDSKKVQDIKNPTFESKKFKASRNSNNYKDKPLPWWVELLFVQIGLPDKLLIKILKSKKLFTNLLINEKKLIVLFERITTQPTMEDFYLYFSLIFQKYSFS